MEALVIYDSQFGNTEQIARTIAASLGECVKTKVMSAEEAMQQELSGFGLLIVGGPTQMHHARPALMNILNQLTHSSLNGVQAATFDTRMHAPKLFSGSAADIATKQLKQAGCRIIAPPESFFVGGSEGPLAEGEIERASKWAHELIETALAA